MEQYVSDLRLCLPIGKLRKYYLSWKLVDRTNSPRSRRLFSVVCWVVTIGLLAIGVVHFSASFDQGLLTVTKMVMTVFVHVVIFACQAATIFYYFTCEDLSITLNRRVQRAIVPALGFAVAFGITESTFMGVYWSSTVLQRGIGALNVFWTVVRTFWVIVYAGTFLMGVLPQTLVRLPSTFFRTRFPSLCHIRCPDELT